MNFDIGMLIVIVLIAGAAAYLYKQSKKDKAPAVVAKPLFPCVIEGNIDMPPMAEVIKAAVIDVKQAGLWHDGMTDEMAVAMCSMPLPNANNFGGGGAYGGRYLTGSFHFEIDATGQRIDALSWVKIFSDEKYPVTGGVRGDGGIGMGSIGGTGISGRIADGKLLDARIEHGDGKPHIYGVLNGVVR